MRSTKSKASLPPVTSSVFTRSSAMTVAGTRRWLAFTVSAVSAACFAVKNCVSVAASVLARACFNWKSFTSPVRFCSCVSTRLMTSRTTAIVSGLALTKSELLRGSTVTASLSAAVERGAPGSWPGR